MHSPADLPYLRTSTRLGGKDANSTNAIYDVKFYPYTDPDQDAVFAAVTARDAFVCRPTSKPEQPYEVLRWFRDAHKEASLNSLAWSQDPVTADPLLCVAGDKSSKIKILNVKTGEVRVIRGHGAAINDLVVSPLSPTILASCSADYSIRLWNLDPKYEKQPTAAILSGEGHKQPILALCFHRNGRYLLSGGQDAMVNLWAVPEVPDKNAGTDNPTIVYYPHFSSTEVHPDYVDCIKFHGDLILSRCSKSQKDKDTSNHILLWKIDGFSSADPTPEQPPIPSPGVYTRSAFGKRFQRLLTFDMPSTSQFYMRFGLFDAPGHHPILAMGNERSRFSFWDLQRLEEGDDEDPTARATGRKRGRAKGSAFGSLGASLVREESLASNASSAPSTTPSSAPPALRKFDLGDPFMPIQPHKTVTIPKMSFPNRQIAWSNDGKWCVAVGDFAMMNVFKRWD